MSIKMKSKTIKLETLIKLNACQNQVDLFKETFGDSVELTEALAKEFCSKFNIDWAAHNLLNEEQLNAYEEAKAHLLKTYEDANAPLLKTYQEANAPLLKTYEEASAPLLKTYQEAKAVEFAKIYIG